MYENASEESLTLFRETLLETLTEIETELKYRKLATEKTSTEVPEAEADTFVRLEAVYDLVSRNTQFFRTPPLSVSQLIELLAKLPTRIIKKNEGEELL